MRLPGSSAFFRLFGNRNYRVQFVDHRIPSLVVRIFQSKERYDSETAAIDAISAHTDVPVPQIMAQSSHTERDQHYIITRYIGSGRLPDLPWLADSAQMAIGQQLGEYLAQIHGLKMGFYGNLTSSTAQNAISVPKEADFTLPIFQNLLTQARRKGVLTSEEEAKVQTYVDHSIGLLTESIPSLIHGDMIDANILIDSIGGSTVISGILDFEHSRAWSPEVDFTKLLDIRLREYPLLADRFLDVYLHNMGITGPSASERFFDRLRLFRLLEDLQLAVNLAEGEVGFFAKLMMGTPSFAISSVSKTIRLHWLHGRTIPEDSTGSGRSPISVFCSRDCIALKL